MTREQRHEQRRRSEKSAAQPRRAKGEGGAKDQGIVRDQRGQEQPADKERAQRASKSE